MWIVRESFGLALMLLAATATGWAATENGRIRISPDYPRSWEYQGASVVLIGGSVEDNLFQIPDLEAHLDLLRDVGGNYVRCSMSSRDEGNVWPFLKVDDKYDLDRWDEEYWSRFENFLRWTSERGIVAQIEVWETFDFYLQYWDHNPFNPKNNRNYTANTSGLPKKIETHPLQLENSFFWSIPAEKNQENVLHYQRGFVERLLSHSLRYGNVLYCMDNETAVTPEWGKYWATLIREKAAEAGVTVETTEMWDPHDLDDPKHNHTFDHPELYSFIDISQNNHQTGQRHWDNAQKQRKRIENAPRPMNNVKIYGSDRYRYGTDRDGIERFWRNVLGGMASARFHRPDSGLGLNEKAQANLRSMRSLLDRIDPFHCEPRNDLLSEREENEAYCFAHPGKECALYFPNGGEVRLHLEPGRWKVEWLHILSSQWRDPVDLTEEASPLLAPPSEDHWAALVTRADSGK